MTTRRRGGATLIEFALLLPVFLSLALGVMDAGWLFWQSAAVQVAVQDGCRTGAIIDAGQDRVYMSDLQAEAEAAIVLRLESLGVGCGDCAVSVTPIEVASVVTLECSMTRTGGSLAGLLPDASLASTILAQMEVQR